MSASLIPASFEPNPRARDRIVAKPQAPPAHPPAGNPRDRSPYSHRAPDQTPPPAPAPYSNHPQALFQTPLQLRELTRPLPESRRQEISHSPAAKQNSEAARPNSKPAAIHPQ